MQSKRVAVLIHGSKWRPIPYGNGGSIVMWKNYSALLEAGYDVKLFQIGAELPNVKYPESMLSELPEYSSIQLCQYRKRFNGRISQWINPIHGMLKGYYPPHTGTWEISHSVNVFNSLNPHLVLAENSVAAQIAIKIWPKAIIIICIHDIDPLLDYNKNLTRLCSKWNKSRVLFNRLLFNWNSFFHWISFLLLMKRMNCIIIIGHRMLNTIKVFRKKVFFSPVAILPNIKSADDIIAFREDYFKTNKKTILYIGKLDNSHTRKSLKVIMDSILPGLIRKFSERDFVLRVIGSKVGAEEIVNKYHSLPCVEFAGFIDNLENEYSRAKCLIVPEGHNSGVRVKIIESLSFGLPVVTSQNEIATLGIKKSEGCLVATEPKEYIKCISSLIENEDYMKKMSKLAFNTYKNNFEPNIVISQLAKRLYSL